MKRIATRAIILFEEKIVLMYRERQGRVYYTFPGGGLETNETEEEGVKREVFEEYGIDIEPIKKVYVYESERSVEHFFVCDWVGGKFGTGQGEEYDGNQTNGLYVPTMVKIGEVPNIPLMPPEVAKMFYDDYIQNGTTICEDVRYIYGEIK